MNRLGNQFIFLFVCFAMIACESEYSQMVKDGLASGKVHEDLILFARHIMLLDSTVQVPKKVDMLFYGIFDEEKIMNGMHMKFSYIKWSPWNEDFQSDVLIKELKDKYLKKYGGNSFIEITVNDDVKAYTKIDGNREILIYPNSDKDVTVKIQDLRKRFAEAL